MKLAVIGTGIGQSRMPLFQRLAGARTGHPLDYGLLDIEDGDPRRFAETFRACAESGYRGVNVTYPFKELAAARVAIEDPGVRAIGAVNTIVFAEDGAQGFNTDHTGFLRAWRGRFGGGAPGAVALVGAGGVGRAIAFALAALGAPELRLFDLDAAKAESLAAALRAATAVAVRVCEDVGSAVAGADGIVNATPLGMHNKPGCPVPAAALGGRLRPAAVFGRSARDDTRAGGQRWAFDAVYTPEDTELLQAARAAGLEVFSGFRLFLGQAADAFEIFTGAALTDEDIAAIEREIRKA